MSDELHLPDGRRLNRIEGIKTLIRVRDDGYAHALIVIDGEVVATAGTLWVQPLRGSEDPLFLNWANAMGEFVTRLLEEITGERPELAFVPANDEAVSDG